MGQILFSTAGVNGKIESDKYTIQKILEDRFTSHYLPDFRILNKTPSRIHFEVLQRGMVKKAEIEYPIAHLNLAVEHRSYVVTAEYLAERARQEELGVFAFNSASAEKNGRGIIFYGHASNLGKSTFANTLFENCQFNLFSDEKTLIDLENRLMVSGSRSIPLRKEIWKKRYPLEEDYREIEVDEDKTAEVEMMITPHYDHGLNRPIVMKLDKLDFFWNLAGAITRRIRGATRFIDNFTYQLPSLDTEELTEERLRLLNDFSDKVRGYYFQGNSGQLIDFINGEFESK